MISTKASSNGSLQISTVSGGPGDAPSSQRAVVAVFCMPENGHFQRLRPLVAGLSGAGLEVRVLTHARFAAQVHEDGGRFVDLFRAYPLEALGDDSLPVPSRFVTYAAAYAPQICADVAASGAGLVVHDSFAVVGRLVAQLLDLPRVNLCAGHNVVPGRFREILGRDPRVSTSAACRRAVMRLRDELGLEDASPFAYLSPPSPQLNLYCEPPQFLNPADRQFWEPVAFFGSLREVPTTARAEAGQGRYFVTPDASVPGRTLRVYISFGTVIWRYYADTALRTLTTLADAIAGRQDVEAVVSLGGSEPGSGVKSALERRNLRVERYVDQQAILAEADVFVTHHGMNSTHEAIAHGVPMLSYPFFWDQPELARKCADLGLSVPLAGTPREPIGETTVHQALETLRLRETSMKSSLEKAMRWEEAVIENRPEVIERIAGLIGEP